MRAILHIMTVHGQVSSSGRAMDLRFAEWRVRPSHIALAISARCGRHLFFCVFFAGLSDSRFNRAARNSTRWPLPSGGRAIPRTLAAIVVCAYCSLVFQWSVDAERAVLGRHGGFGASCFEFLAPRNAGHMLCLFSFLHRRGAGFFQLPIGRHVIGSWIHLLVLCATRIAPRAGANPSALACEPLPSPVGMVSDLLRIRDGEDSERRSRMAPFHCHG